LFWALFYKDYIEKWHQEYQSGQTAEEEQGEEK
jgi:hypothetical protein